MEEKKERKSAAAVVGALVGQIVTCAVCVVVGWMAKGWLPQKAENGDALNPMAAMADMAQTVAVTNAQLRAYNRPESFVAHAEPVQEVDLLPQVDGYILEVKFKEGDTVKAGQKILTFDRAKIKAAGHPDTVVVLLTNSDDLDGVVCGAE